MITWPQNLIKDIATRKAVIFLGSGISRNAISRDGTTRPPTWDQFLRLALQQVQGDTDHILELLSEKDYLTACEIIFDRLGEVNFNDLAVSLFLRPGFEPHQIHESIYKLDSRIVATPNVDKIYDTYANQVSRGTVIVKNYYDDDLASKIRSQDFIIIKVHGTVERPDKMIFTRKQYTSARYQYSAFYQILNALAITHSFIFLGCGFYDPDIRLVLENYTFMHPHCRPHYFVTASENISEDFRKTIARNLNLEIVCYNSDNNHQELVDSLTYLVSLVEAEREEIASKRYW